MKSYPNGGTAFIDLSVYGEITSAAENTAKANELALASQLEKPVLIVGLNLKTVGKFSPFFASFTSATASGVTTYTAALPATPTGQSGAFQVGRIAVTSAGKIIVTKGA